MFVVPREQRALELAQLNKGLDMLLFHFDDGLRVKAQNVSGAGKVK